MTRPWGTPNELSPDVSIAPELRTSAGASITVPVIITNRAPEPRVMAVTTLGVDGSWLPRPTRTAAVLPGHSVTCDVTLRPAPGTVPARYPLAVAVQALAPGNERAASAAVIAETTLLVDAPGQIEVELDPPDVSGYFRRRLTVKLHNRAPVADVVRLEVHSAEPAEVRLSDETVEVPAGGTVPVRARVRIEPRLFGNRARYTYTVSARGSGASRRAEGSVTARAVLGANGPKAFTLLAVVTVWVAMALVFIPKLSTAVKNGQDKTSNAAGALQSEAVNQVPGGSAAPSGGASGGSGGGSGGSSGSGGGSGGSGGGSGGSGGGGGGSGGSSGSGASASAVQLNGTVSGRSPGGVDVSIAPTSLVNEDAQGATPLGFQATELTTVGKIPGSALLVSAPSRAVQSRSTVTDTDGAWSFARVRAPGYYLLTFAKPGYQTQRYIIDSTATVATQPLSVELAPGQGRLSGRISGPSGGVGGAQVTITDGTNTVTTSSNSKGDTGAWSVDGLSTPSTYLVSASKDGMSTESGVVSLGAGGTSAVNLRLQVGVASLVGDVRGPDSLGTIAGLGGVQVTATDGTTNYTATTVTAGKVAGHYTLPGLAPGRYSVTASAPGYLPQTQRVTIKKGQSRATVNAMLSSASAVVTGVVTGVQFNDDGTVQTRAGGTTPVVGPLNGAGLTLSSADNTYKITSAADGSFRIDGVVPGQYTLSAQYSGLTPSYVAVTAVAGQPTEVPTAALEMKAEQSVNTSTITGFVSSAVSPSGVLKCPDQTSPGNGCAVKFSLLDSDGDAVPTRTDGASPFTTSPEIDPSTTGPTAYTLTAENGLAPGLYHLIVTSTGFLPSTVNVRVPLNTVAQAPQVALFPGNTISGTIDALGDMINDGPAGPYTNCVWAVPVNDSFVPTDCNFSPPVQSPCQTSGVAETAFDTISADRQYALKNLCDGAYNVYVIVANPWYINPSPTASQTVTHGQTITYAPHVARKGRVILNVQLMDVDDGQPSTPPDTLTGTAKCGTTVAQLDKLTGPVVIQGVDAGNNVTCTVTTAGNPTFSGAVQALSVGNDNDTAASVVLARSLGTVVGRVVSPYGGSATNPVGSVTVALAGTVGFNGAAGQGSQVVLTTNEQGCFVVKSKDTDPIPDFGCGTFPPASVRTMSLISSRVQLAVASGVGTQGLSNTAVTLDPGQLNDFSVRPTPVHTDGLAVTAGVAIDLSQVKLTVSASAATGSGSVQAFPTSGGQILWTDSVIGQRGLAWPGTYAIKATLPGFSDATATITCGFGTPQCTMTPLQLNQLGTLSGTVTGFLGTNTTYPSQPLAGALVTAVPCDSAGTNCSTDPAAAFKGTADSGGTFQLLRSGQPYLTPGKWRITAGATGYSNFPAADASDLIVDVNPGSNDTGNIQMFTKQVTVTVKIQTGPSSFFSCPSGQPDCATVTLNRVETGETFSPSSVRGSSYVFDTLNPALYLITISGDGLRQTTTQYTVPLGSNPTVAVPVARVQNSVFGTVQGPVGKSGNLTSLNDVPVELGHLDSSNAFVPDDGTDGNPLVTKTANSAGLPGQFTFGNAPNGSYVARVNHATTGFPAKSGYGELITSTVVSVSGGQGARFDTITVPRVTHDVKVMITTTDPADDVSRLTVALTSSSDATWQLTPQSPTSEASDTGPGTKYTWVFNAVPFGDWTASVTLPPTHFGTLAAVSGAPAMTCSAGTATAPVACTSAALTVPGTGNPNKPVDAGYTIDEYRVGLTVVANRHSSDPHAVVPVTALKVTAPGGATVYQNDAFPVVDTAPTPSTDSFWGKGGVTYNGTATTTADNWPTATQTYTKANPARPVQLAEVGATVTVTFDASALPNGADPTLSVSLPGHDTQTGKHATDTVTFTDVSYGNPSVTVAGSYHVAAQGSTPAHDVNVTGQANVIVDSSPVEVPVILTTVGG
jgi:hypothetical protein